MTRDELASISLQLRDAAVQPEGDAQVAAESFNGWLGRCRERLRAAVLLHVRGETVPEKVAIELRQAATAAGARRAVLEKAYGGEF